MESSCQCLSAIYVKHLGREQMEITLKTCATVASLAEDIVCSISIQNSSIFRRTVHLYLRTLPAVVECTVREALLAGFKIHIQQKLSGCSRSFEQCFDILKAWSQSSRVGALWSSIVNPGHLRATRFGGEVEDTDGHDASFEERTITFVDRCGESQSKQESHPLLQLESDRAWTWAFGTLFDVHGMAVEDSLFGILKSDQKNCFPSETEMVSYIVHRIAQFRELIQQAKLVLSDASGGTLGDALALVLPQPNKGAFRSMIDQILKALGGAIEILGEFEGDAELRQCRLAESLAWAMAWIYDTNAGTDFVHGICLWSYSETRVANRLKRGNKIHVSDNKSSISKKLEKLVLGAREVEGLPDKLCSRVQEGSDKCKRLVDCWNKSAERLGLEKTMKEALASKAKYLQEHSNLHGEKLRLAGSPATRARSQRKRRAPSSGHTGVRRSRKEKITQSRNNLVRSWLQSDREVGKEEKYQEDGYADLEDFLVDG